MQIARPLLLGLAILALTAGVAGATHSNGTGPKNDFVNGTGNVVDPLSMTIDAMSHVNAKSGPSGEDAQGAFFVKGLTTLGELDFHGSVTCLAVTGNHAVVGGLIERSKTPTAAEGEGFLFEFVDNGEPGSDPDLNPPDSLNGVLLPTPPPPSLCVFPFALIPISRGNFVVHDAAP